MSARLNYLLSQVFPTSSSSSSGIVNVTNSSLIRTLLESIAEEKNENGLRMVLANSKASLRNLSLMGSKGLSTLLCILVAAPNSSQILEIASQLVSLIGSHSLDPRSLCFVLDLVSLHAVSRSRLLPVLRGLSSAIRPEFCWDFDGQSSAILLPNIPSWPGSHSYSVSMWVRFEEIDSERKQTIFVFQTGDLDVVEIFFMRGEMHIQTGKLGKSMSLRKAAGIRPARGRWTFLAFSHVHHVMHPSVCTVLIDNEIALDNATLSYPKVGGRALGRLGNSPVPWTRSDIVLPPPSNATGLWGQMGPVYLFSRAAPVDLLRQIFAFGPDHCFNFEGNQSSSRISILGGIDITDLNPFDRSSKLSLVLALHPKACVSDICLNNAPDTDIGDGRMAGNVALLRMPTVEHSMYSVGGLKRILFFFKHTAAEGSDPDLAASILLCLARYLHNSPALQREMLEHDRVALLAYAIEESHPRYINNALVEAVNTLISAVPPGPLQDEIFKRLLYRNHTWVRANASTLADLFAFQNAHAKQRAVHLRSKIPIQTLVDELRTITMLPETDRPVPATVWQKAVFDLMINLIVGASQRYPVAAEDMGPFFNLATDTADEDFVTNMLNAVFSLFFATTKSLLPGLHDAMLRCGFGSVCINLLSRPESYIRILSLKVIGIFLQTCMPAQAQELFLSLADETGSEFTTPALHFAMSLAGILSINPFTHPTFVALLEIVTRNVSKPTNDEQYLPHLDAPLFRTPELLLTILQLLPKATVLVRQTILQDLTLILQHNDANKDAFLALPNWQDHLLKVFDSIQNLKRGSSGSSSNATPAMNASDAPLGIDLLLGGDFAKPAAPAPSSNPSNNTVRLLDDFFGGGDSGTGPSGDDSAAPAAAAAAAKATVDVSTPLRGSASSKRYVGPAIVDPECGEEAHAIVSLVLNMFGVVLQTAMRKERGWMQWVEALVYLRFTVERCPVIDLANFERQLALRVLRGVASREALAQIRTNAKPTDPIWSNLFHFALSLEEFLFFDSTLESGKMPSAAGTTATAETPSNTDSLIDFQDPFSSPPVKAAEDPSDQFDSFKLRRGDSKPDKPGKWQDQDLVASLFQLVSFLFEQRDRLDTNPIWAPIPEKARSAFAHVFELVSSRLGGGNADAVMPLPQLFPPLARKNSSRLDSLFRLQIRLCLHMLQDISVVPDIDEVETLISERERLLTLLDSSAGTTAPEMARSYHESVTNITRQINEICGAFETYIREIQMLLSVLDNAIAANPMMQQQQQSVDQVAPRTSNAASSAASAAASAGGDAGGTPIIDIASLTSGGAGLDASMTSGQIQQPAAAVVIKPVMGIQSVGLMLEGQLLLYLIYFLHTALSRAILANSAAQVSLINLLKLLLRTYRDVLYPHLLSSSGSPLLSSFPEWITISGTRSEFVEGLMQNPDWVKAFETCCKGSAAAIDETYIDYVRQARLQTEATVLRKISLDSETVDRELGKCETTRRERILRMRSVEAGRRAAIATAKEQLARVSAESWKRLSHELSHVESEETRKVLETLQPGAEGPFAALLQEAGLAALGSDPQQQHQQLIGTGASSSSSSAAASAQHQQQHQQRYFKLAKIETSTRQRLIFKEITAEAASHQDAAHINLPVNAAASTSINDSIDLLNLSFDDAAKPDEQIKKLIRRESVDALITGDAFNTGTDAGGVDTVGATDASSVAGSSVAGSVAGSEQGRSQVGSTAGESGTADPLDNEWSMVEGEEMYSTNADREAGAMLFRERCMLVRPLNTVYGYMELTPTRISFVVERKIRLFGDDVDPVKQEQIQRTANDKTWMHTEFRDVFKRRYVLRHTAVELMTHTRRAYFFNLYEEAIADQFYRKFVAACPKGRVNYDMRAPAEQFRKSNITLRWQKREISNFEYLMALNTLAGRTFNDLSQYPIFPWVIADYSSKTLNLDDPATYRDLSKPIGALNPERARQFMDRYNSWSDPDTPKFHYGSHYSTPGAVLFFLVRTEPYSTAAITLQSGKFDLPDRLFHSMEQTWNHCTGGEILSDVKELIPEFYYLPEIFMNRNRLPLGVKQSGEIVDDVILPPWASSAEDFVIKNRQALESEYVSQHLHEWIDLVFGFKQRGLRAVTAINVYYFLTYEGTVNYAAITDPIQRRAIETQIQSFGQTPVQLLTTAHPRRDAAGTPPALPFRLPPIGVHILSGIQVVGVAASRVVDQTLYMACFGELRLLSFRLRKCLPDAQGVLPQEAKLHRSDAAQPPQVAFNPVMSKVKLPFASSHQNVAGFRWCCFSRDGRFLFTGGHWDNSVLVHGISGKDTKAGNIVQRLSGHFDTVTCVTLAQGDRYLITGSMDCTVRVWRLVNDKNGPVRPIPEFILHGHLSQVNAISVDSTLGVIASASADMILLHTLNDGMFLRAIRFMNAPISPCSVARGTSRFSLPSTFAGGAGGLGTLIDFPGYNPGNVLASSSGGPSGNVTHLMIGSTAKITAFCEVQRTVRCFNLSGELCGSYEAMARVTAMHSFSRKHCVIIGYDNGKVEVRSNGDLALISILAQQETASVSMPAMAPPSSGSSGSGAMPPQQQLIVDGAEVTGILLIERDEFVVIVHKNATFKVVPFPK